MKNVLPLIIFCVFPFIMVLLFEGLSPFTYATGLLTLIALLTSHVQANTKVRNTDNDSHLDFEEDGTTILQEAKVKTP